MTTEQKEQSWYEMRAIRRRPIASAVWVPLRLREHIEETGQQGYDGYVNDFVGLGSIAVPLARRADADTLGWSSLGLMHEQRSYAGPDWYKPADIYQYDDNVDLGIELILVQSFPGPEPTEWHLNQDIAIALGLLREKDEWLRPAEAYTPVARLRRDSDGRAVALEMKNEFLRDYLAARHMALRISQFRMRESVTVQSDHIAWPGGRLDDRSNGLRFEGRVISIIEGGHPAGDSSYAVFRISRTDVDPEEDVPRPGPENDANVASESWTGTHRGPALFRITGEFWREEWIEPAAHSARVRGDKVRTGIHYIVDEAGTRAPSEELEDDNDPRWLWFRSAVIPALLGQRGGSLEWYTRETGGVSCSPGYDVHFGVNDIGLITAFASDIAGLPTWQQQIWAGFNTAPEGGVSKELLSAQMSAIVAETTAPEAVLPDILRRLDQTFARRIGLPLFRQHPSTDELIAASHRFRATEAGGFLSLAKDLVRLTADRIDAAALQKAVPPPAKEKWGSLKSLEKYLASIIPPDEAHQLMSPMFAAYDLRLGDAHLPASDLDDAYRHVKVDRAANDLEQGFRLLASVVTALMNIERAAAVK